MGEFPIAAVEPLLTTRAVVGPFDYLLPEELSAQVGVGAVLRVPFAGRPVAGVVVELRDRSELDRERLRAPLTDLGLRLPAELVELARWLAATYCSTLARSLALMLPPGTSRFRRPRRLADPKPPAGGREEPPQLTDEQGSAVAEIVKAMEQGGPLLLQGVTGSGKTEVYLQAAAAALARGRGVIVLVPEIALTPQTAARFQRRFGETVVVIHSGLSSAQRVRSWLALREGRAKICLGPRSAVFAPVSDLGLIVIDEEHDPSYKHEADPRYDARRVAVRRGELAGAVVVAGSATPRAESYATYRRLPLRRRIDGTPLPTVEVLDMRGVGSTFHPHTVEALSGLRRCGGKGVVLLNRRGFSLFLACTLCGRVWGCPNCDVSLVVHRQAGILACHHCGYQERLPARCSCGSRSLARVGVGTERLAAELEELLGPQLPVFRLDSDVLARGKGAAEQVLGAFAEADAGLLLGTQLVAKGHDFPGLALGVVLNAEAGLRFPDFRAEERTFALVTQLSGRVGRGSKGRVLVQTLEPEARAIRYAAGHDAEGFLRSELERRRRLGYPPFKELVRVIVAGGEEAAVAEAATALRLQFAGRLEDSCQLLGPAQLLRLHGNYRRALLIKGPTLGPVVATVGAVLAQEGAALRRLGVKVAVDVDPH